LYALGYYFIDSSSYEKIEDLKITGYNGTAAEQYAKVNGFEFISLGEVPPADDKPTDPVDDEPTNAEDDTPTDGEDDNPTDTEDKTKGDISGDGTVNVSDISMLAAHVKGIKKLSDTSAADLNGDGNVNVTDISMLAAHVKGIKKLS
jgi:hypothetical protein